MRRRPIVLKHTRVFMVSLLLGGSIMKVVTILTSLVLVLGLAASASADLTWDTTSGFGGSWSSGVTWGGDGAPTNLGGAVWSGDVAELQLNLGDGTLATEISAAGGFIVQFDL
jgi:hypothetical protein